MNSPGFKSLGAAVNITTAGTQVTDWTTVDLDGLTAAAAQFRFTWGSGGTNAKVYLQTTLDQGTTPIDIACAVFTTANEIACFNFSALTPKMTQVTPTDGALADDSAIDGILGDSFRFKVVSTGTYAGSTNVVGGIVVR